MDAALVLDGRVLGDLYASENNRLAKLLYEGLLTVSSSTTRDVQISHLPPSFAVELTSLFGLGSDCAVLTPEKLCAGIVGMSEHFAARNVRIQERANTCLRVRIALLEEQYAAAASSASAQLPACEKVISPEEKEADEVRLHEFTGSPLGGRDASVFANEDAKFVPFVVSVAAEEVADDAASPPPPVLFRAESVVQGTKFTAPPAKLFVCDAVSVDKSSRCLAALFATAAAAGERGSIPRMNICGRYFTSRQEFIDALESLVETWMKTDSECQMIISFYLQRKLRHACRALAGIHPSIEQHLPEVPDVGEVKSSSTKIGPPAPPPEHAFDAWEETDQLVREFLLESHALPDGRMRALPYPDIVDDTWWLNFGGKTSSHRFEFIKNDWGVYFTGGGSGRKFFSPACVGDECALTENETIQSLAPATKEDNRCFFIHLGAALNLHPYLVHSAFRHQAAKTISRMDAALAAGSLDDTEVAAWLGCDRENIESLALHGEFVDQRVLRYIWPDEFDDIRLMIVPIMPKGAYGSTTWINDFTASKGEITSLNVYTPHPSAAPQHFTASGDWKGRDVLMCLYWRHFFLLKPKNDVAQIIDTLEAYAALNEQPVHAIHHTCDPSADARFSILGKK